MDVETFVVTIAAVIIGNALCGVVVYASWYATKAKQRLGITEGDGSDLLPFPLLAACCLPGLVVLGAGFLLV